MNGYERITAALKNIKPDTTPIMLHNFMMAAREHGVTMDQYRNDPQVIAGSFISSVEKYGYDGVLVDIDTVTLAGAVGVPVDFPEDQPARTHHGCLENLEDVSNKTLELLEIYKSSNRFILNAGCAIPAETPSDNLKAMIKMAREF